MRRPYLEQTIIDWGQFDRPVGDGVEPTPALPLMAITVRRSIQIEQLADALAQRIQEKREQPFRQEVILVDGKALSNWLSHYLVNQAKLADGSRGLGVHMRAELMNTTRFATWAKLALANQPDSERINDPLSTLPTRIFRWLGENPEVFKLPAEAGDGGAARLDLANRLADWLGELIRDDPEWILDAEKMPSGRLERLWQAMATELREEEGLGLSDALTAADVLRILESRAEAREALAERVPGRIHMLSTSDVSITLLRSLKALSAKLEVHTYLLQPSTGFHLDLEKATAKKRIGYEHVGGEETEQGIPMETPGALFLRQTAKHFRRQLEVTIDELDVGGECDPNDSFAPTVLGGLREAIADFDAPPDRLTKRANNDDTVSINRCHTPLREVEVLRDEILKAMAANPSLKARDILVLSPDPATYAPLMAGVLNLREPSIGFTTAGVEGSTKSPLADLATRLLELPAGRFTAQEVLEICELAVIGEKFGWEAGRPDRIRRWFKEAPFFWGMDAEHRGELTKQAFPEWSAADFRNRLALGTALLSELQLEGEPGTLPMESLEGREDLGLAADLMIIVDRLRLWSRTAQKPRSPGEWSALFAEHLINLMPEDGESAEERVAVERALAAIQACCEVAGDKAIDLATFRTLALPHLDIDFARGQFLSGGVTLAPLKAGNIHPAKMIAMVGMADGSYPQRGVAPGPELETTRRTQAERARDQSEQRGMHTVMLALTAAQERLVMTFPGYAGDSGKDAAAALPVELTRMACSRICPSFRTHRHGLLSHEAGRASDDDKTGVASTLTHDSTALAIADTLASKERRTPIPTLTLDASTWPLQEWVDFWKNPVQGAFERAQAEIPWINEELPSDEPLETGRKWKDRKAAKWMQAYLNKHGAHADWRVASATGLFPMTSSGHSKYVELCQELQETEPGDEQLEEELKYFMGHHRDKAEKIDHGTTHFLRALHNGSWLVLTLGSDDINDTDLLKGITALAYLQRQYPKLRNVAVIGPIDPTIKQVGKGYRGRCMTGAHPDLSEKFMALASRALGDSLVLGPMTFQHAAIGAFSSGAKAKGATAESLKSFNGYGDATDRYSRLVQTGVMDFQKINDLMRAILAGGERHTATEIRNKIEAMPDEEANR